MAHDHARLPRNRAAGGWHRPSAPEEDVTAVPAQARPVTAEAVQSLQRAYGNQLVQRMLAPQAAARGGILQRNRGTFTYGHRAPEQTVIRKQEELNEAVESVIEDYFDGPRTLFVKNDVATSTGQWCDFLHTYMQDDYDLQNLGRNEVLRAVEWVKAKHREEALLHMSESYISWAGGEAPSSVDDLRTRLEDAGAYLDEDDDEALEAMLETEGKFARTKVPLPPGHLELSDEDNIVVWMDDHQQKHQRDKIPEFKAYIGEPGDKFAPGKDLQWHVDNTVPVVRQTIADAIEEGTVTPTKRYSPPKDAINGINYDLTITYDDLTGKFVGSYHCNPVADEG